MKEEFSHKDFTIPSLDTDAIDRSFMFQKYIDQLKNHNHEIYWIEACSALTPLMKIRDNRSGETKEVLSFVSNDYLGMSQRKETIQAGVDALYKYGTGVCAAPIIGGYMDIHKELENNIAKFTGQEDALLFSSGFGTNVGTLNAILGKKDLAFVDTAVHSSVLDGLRGTNVKYIGHNDPEYLDFCLGKMRNDYKTIAVIVDGVYSQDGDIGLIPEINSICKKHNVILVVDDAHGIGVFGPNGRGIAEHYNMLGEIDLITGTLSKSFGSVGGFAAGSKQMIQYLRYYANTTVFSASIIPQVTCSVFKALEIIKEEPQIRTKLWDNTKYLKNRLSEEGFDMSLSESPIIPILIRDDYKVKEVTRLLLEDNIYTIGIVYPAVRSKDARIRISVTASHEISQLDRLVNSLCKINERLPII